MEPTTPRGLLFLDIDGVFSPWEPPGPSSGYRTWTGRTPNFRGGKRDLTVWYDPDHGDSLLELSRELNLELVWASQGWSRSDANNILAPLLGFPELESAWIPSRNFSFTTWKFPFVSTYVDNNGRLPFAWLDDAFGEACKSAKAEFRRMYPDAALINVDGRYGLKPGHLDAVRTWAGGLPGARP